jgi:hypothetical protein
MSERLEFRPERRLFVVQAIASILLLFGITMMVRPSVDDGRWMVLIPVALLVIAIGVLLVSTLRMRVTLDPNQMTIVGMLRTTTVSRHRVVGVGLTDSPHVDWIDDNGRARYTLAFALYEPAGLRVISADSHDRRRRFVEQVREWAGQSAAPDPA